MTIAKQACCDAEYSGPVATALRRVLPVRLWSSGGRALSSGPVILAFLLPKCPLCFAAYAAALGVGAAGQRFLMVPWLRPMLIALAATPLLTQIALAARSRLRSRRKSRTPKDVEPCVQLITALLPVVRSRP